jgi:hypothetical protein
MKSVKREDVSAGGEQENNERKSRTNIIRCKKGN